MKNAFRKPHVAKSITYRFLGSLDTFLLAWYISGDASTGLKISLAEVVIKMVLYYFPERVWYNAEMKRFWERDSQEWHLLKNFSCWRMLGTMGAMILAGVNSGDPVVGFKVGILQVFTKMIIYYLHERVWYSTDYGLPVRINSEIIKNG